MLLGYVFSSFIVVQCARTTLTWLQEYESLLRSQPALCFFYFYVFFLFLFFALCWCNVMYIWWNEFCSWGPAAIFNQNYSFWGRTCEFRRTKADGIWTLSNFHHSEVQAIAGCASSFEKDSRGKHYRPEQHSHSINLSTMTNLAPEVFCWSSSPSFSTAPLLTGLEFDPEEGERKAMNEFFLIVLSCFVFRCWLLIQIHVKNKYADHLDGLAEW